MMNNEYNQNHEVRVYPMPQHTVSEYAPLLKLKRTANSNPLKENRVTFIDQKAGVAAAGHRRFTDVGDLLNIMFGNIGDGSILPADFAGIYNYETDEYIEQAGLLGKSLVDENNRPYREVNDSLKLKKMAKDLSAKKFNYELKINPAEWLEFIKVHEENMHQKVINLLPTHFTNTKGMMVGKVIINYGRDGHKYFIIEFRAKDTVLNYRVKKDSTFKLTDEHIGKSVYFKQIGEAESPDDLIFRVCDVYMEFVPGIHATVQEYQAGVKMPTDDDYSVVLGEHGNTLSFFDKKIFPFTNDQDKMSMIRTPMLTFPFDIFVSAMTFFSDYKEVTLKTDGQSETTVLVGEPINGIAQVSVFSQMSPHIVGKVLTP